MKNCTIQGVVSEHNGKYNASITIETSEGEKATVQSGFVFLTEEEATNAMNVYVNEVVREFKNEGAEVTKLAEGYLQ
jgi:hypothetical protein